MSKATNPTHAATPGIVQSECVPLSAITPNKGQIEGVPKNPRFIRDEKYRKLLQSIKDDPEMLGLREILLFRHKGENVILGGNMRFRALKELGYTEAIVKFLPDDTPPAKLRAVVIKDNSGFGEWDFDLLANEWSADDLNAWAVDLPEIGDVEGEEEAKEDDSFDADAATPDEPTSRLGDIYALGPHRLVCGDCTKSETIASLLRSADVRKVDMLLTDPPYNVDYKGASCQRKIENDNMDEERFRQFLIDSLSIAGTALKAGGSFYIWHADSHGLTFRESAEEAGLTLKQCLVWVKNSLVLGRQDYQWIHEPCLYGWKEGAAHYFRNVRSEITAFFEAHPDIDQMSKEELRQGMKLIEALPTTVIREDKPRRSELHPTMKPVKLMGRCILNSTRPHDAVLDIFGGSGSTLIACEQLGRRCLMTELEPIYIDVIIKRWEELTGKQARKLGNFLGQEEQGE